MNLAIQSIYSIHTHEPADLLQNNSTLSLQPNSNDTCVNTSEAETETVSNPLGNSNFDYNLLAFSFKKPDTLYIENSVCLKCSRGCENETLTCYLCKLAVHYCCYPSQCTDELKTLAKGNFKNVNTFKQHKWFCKDCSKLTFQNVSESISSSFNEQLMKILNMFQNNIIEEVKGVVSEVRNGISEDINNALDKNSNSTHNVHKNCNNTHNIDKIRNVAHPPKINITGKSSHLSAPAGQRTAALIQNGEYQLTNSRQNTDNHEEFNPSTEIINSNCTNSQQTIPENSQQIITEETLGEDWGSSPEPIITSTRPTWSNIAGRSSKEHTQRTNEKAYHSNQRNPQGAHPGTNTNQNYNKNMYQYNRMKEQIPTIQRNEKSVRKVNQDLTVIVENVISRDLVKHPANIKSEFNRHFKDMEIKSCFTTRGGAVLIELTTVEDVKTVEKNWKGHFFTDTSDHGNNKKNTAEELADAKLEKELL